MQIIGIVGGIGVGKSEITKLLRERFNAFIINADEIWHLLLEKDNLGYNKVIENFGREILDEQNNIDRKKLGNIVFSDKDKLNALNYISHPMIYDEIKRIISEVKCKRAYDYIILEAAILYEGRFTELVDRIWLITCTKEKRIERLMTSRKITKEKIESIISKQKKDIELMNMVDRTIDNSYSLDETYKQIKEIL